MAVEALGAIGGEQVICTLEQAVTDDDEAVRALVVERLVEQYRRHAEWHCY
jgi:hypothetical protein